MSEITPEERLEQIGRLATDLLVALHAWALQPDAVRTAAVRLTVALAAVPEPTSGNART